MTPKERSVFLTVAKRFGTPLYVYDAKVLRERCSMLRKSFPDVAVHYAVKANSNLALLKVIQKEGLGIETVSPGELQRAKQAGFPKSLISFTCVSLSAEEVAYAARQAGTVHLDSLNQLETWGRLKLGKSVSLRVNQGIGSGHHKHTVTGGPNSKFGITLKDLPTAKRTALKHGLKIRGISQHIGSGILSAYVYMKGVEALLSVVREMPDVKNIDFGGGLGIPYRPSEKAWDLPKLGKRFSAALKRFEKETGRKFSYALEPGRYIVAECGTLLATVVDEKRTTTHSFVGINTGFNHLMRPVMYGSYHAIENVTNPKGRKEKITVAGNVCESGDVFAWNRPVAAPRIGDIFALRNTGAYGMSMASEYNLRALPREVLIEGTRIRDISA